MRFKIDEDLPQFGYCFPSGSRIRRGGDCNGAGNGWLEGPALWVAIQEEGRFLITADKGFADLRITRREATQVSCFCGLTLTELDLCSGSLSKSWPLQISSLCKLLGRRHLPRPENPPRLTWHKSQEVRSLHRYSTDQLRRPSSSKERFSSLE